METPKTTSSVVSSSSSTELSTSPSQHTLLLSPNVNSPIKKGI